MVGPLLKVLFVAGAVGLVARGVYRAWRDLAESQADLSESWYRDFERLEGRKGWEGPAWRKPGEKNPEYEDIRG